VFLWLKVNLSSKRLKRKGLRWKSTRMWGLDKRVTRPLQSHSILFMWLSAEGTSVIPPLDKILPSHWSHCVSRRLSERVSNYMHISCLYILFIWQTFYPNQF